MCGIFCHVASKPLLEGETEQKSIEELLQPIRRRGPDAFGSCTRIVQSRLENGPMNCFFAGALLHMRGLQPQKQPLEDAATGSLLLWNGEIYDAPFAVAPHESDTEVLFAQLKRTKAASCEEICQIFAQISGEFAFVYFDAIRGKLYYGRDIFGRRSLIVQHAAASFTLSSVAVRASDGTWQAAEVDCSGVHVIDIATQKKQCFAWAGLQPRFERLLTVKTTVESVDWQSTVQQTLRALQRAVERRLQPLPPNSGESVAVLFSGGVDCTVLARLCDLLLPAATRIDLLNVAFENERFMAQNPHSPPFDVPDRVTGRASWQELRSLSPKRRFRFVKVNVSRVAYEASRSHVCRLMTPQATVMDLSIGAALWHAAAGRGIVEDPLGGAEHATCSVSPLVLVGIGADELFGGYTRHKAAFAAGGWASFAAELQLDLRRISVRNLGRDDRVIGDCAKEARFPFLDEEFVEHVAALPPNAKCDFDCRGGDAIRCQKTLLRAVADALGLRRAAGHAKRAIQFGARTARMSCGTAEAGTDLLSDCL